MSTEKSKTAEPKYKLSHITFRGGVWLPDRNQSTLVTLLVSDHPELAISMTPAGTVTIVGPFGRVTVPAAQVLAIRETVEETQP